MYEQNVKVIPTHEDIFGTKGKTEAEIINELKEFSSLAIVHMCAQLMLFLNSTDALSPAKQTELALGLLDNDTRKKLSEFIKERAKDTPQVAFFHHAPVMMLMKLNLGHNDINGSNIDDETRNKFVSLLISITDIWTTTERLKTNSNSPLAIKIFKEGFRGYQARQFLQENPTEAMNNLLVRGRYLIDKARANGRLSIDKTFKKATGIDLTLYLDILLMLMPSWTINVKEMSKLPNEIVRTPTKFFAETTVNKNDIEKFLKIVGFYMADYPTLNQELLSRVDMAGDKSLINFVTFMIKPILRYDDNFLCLSPNFLLLQLTDGVYNIIREELKGTKEADLLPIVWGDAYEEYILERLKSTFGQTVYANIKDKNGSEVLDVLIDLDDVALIGEIKYPHWSFKARITGKRIDMYSFIDKIARYRPKKERPGQPIVNKKKGLGQIKYFIEKADNGTVVPPVNLSKKLLLPVLILGEEYPCDPLNRQLLEGYAASEGCLLFGDKRVLPFIVLTSEDIELLESMVEELGIDTTKKILLSYVMRFHPKNKDKAFIKHPTSFKNEVFNRGISVKNSKFMKSQLDASFDPVKKYFKQNPDNQLTNTNT